MTEKMLADIADGVGWLTINNPERRNAVSMDMALRGADIVAQFVADPAVRVIVIRGAGDKAWMSGADISDLGQRGPSPETPAPGQRSAFEFYDAVRDAPKPTIAMIRGYCFGGGVALACACDIRIVAEDAQFSIPAGRLGVGYRAAFTRWIVETVGAPMTKEILYTARRYDAAEAGRIGLAQRVVPVAELESFTRAYAASIVANAPLSVRASKGIVNQVVKSPSDWDMQLCERLAADCTASADFAEGRRAFAEKRPPQFKGV